MLILILPTTIFYGSPLYSAGHVAVCYMCSVVPRRLYASVSASERYPTSFWLRIYLSLTSRCVHMNSLTHHIRCVLTVLTP